MRIEDTCGRNIVVGVDEVDERDIRPFVGININETEPIEKAMVRFNGPYYQPRVFFEQVDGKTVMVIWVTARERRLYKIHARRHCNPRPGEFLKELHLPEGRETEFPTIHEELRKNCSPDSIIEADDEHTYFIIHIPLSHRICVRRIESMDKDGHILPIGEVWKPDVTDYGTDVADNVIDISTAEKRHDEMLRLMKLWSWSSKSTS